MRFRIAEEAFKKQFYKQIKGHNIYIVDGVYVRTNMDEEFTDFAQHFRFPNLIPEKEIWIDQEAEPGEINYFITSAITEYDEMAKGKSYEDAHDIANKAEKTQREKTMIRKDDVRIRLWKTLPKSKVKVYIVDGEAVRNQYKIDFTEGGNPMVYDFIPANTIWIDNDVEVRERKYILAHEFCEMTLMKTKNLSYNDAHRRASELESSLRKKKK